MCPNCRAFVTSSDRVCPYCDVKIGARAIDRRTSPSGMIAGFIPNAKFTISMILLVNFALYLASMAFAAKATGSSFDLPGTVLYRLGAKYGPSIAAGEWWRLVTAGALHGGMFHLLMNSWALFDLGSQVEEIYGSSRLILLYVLSTIGGFYASYLWSPVLSVGSSAGIFGLIGVMIALGVGTRSALGDHVKSLYIRWAVYGLLFGLMPFFHIDNAAHIGGLAVGFGLGWLVGLPNLINENREALIRWLSYASLAVAVGCFALMFRQLVGS